MIQILCEVTALEEVGPRLFELTLHAPPIARDVRAGQFINIKVQEWGTPLLRRPFSVYRVSGESLSIIFNIVGAGTAILAQKRKGDSVDVIGPLGHAFGVDGPYESALLIGGGLGVAPFPLLSSALRDTPKTIATFLGARTKDQLVVSHLENVHLATDDGSAGFHGTVVELLRRELARFGRPKIFGCGPNPMLAALSAMAADHGVPCELSLESAMACGIGICQGCPVELAHGDRKYALICKEGPVFSSASVVVR